MNPFLSCLVYTVSFAASQVSFLNPKERTRFVAPWHPCGRFYETKNETSIYETVCETPSSRARRGTSAIRPLNNHNHHLVESRLPSRVARGLTKLFPLARILAAANTKIVRIQPEHRPREKVSQGDRQRRGNQPANGTRVWKLNPLPPL